MKKLIYIITLLASTIAHCQDFKVKLGLTASESLEFKKDEQDNKFSVELNPKKIFIAASGTAEYVIKHKEKQMGTFTASGIDHFTEISSQLEIDKPIQIFDKQDENVLVAQFSFVSRSTPPTSGTPVNATNGNQGTTNNSSTPPLSVVLARTFPKIVPTEFGLQVYGSSATKYRGKKYVHIFFDQFGNNIFSTIPQGISNLQYVVHLFFLKKPSEELEKTYAVNQTSGEFDATIVFNNADLVAGLNPKAEGGIENKQPEKQQWHHAEVLLSTSTTNITFDIIKSKMQPDDNINKQVLGTYTIKMSKVFHGSFDVGLLNTNLVNPTFELVDDPTPANVGQKIVKQTDGSNRGVVSLMASFYVSPVIIAQKLLGRDIPTYKLSGRNFLDDHKIYERIYPTIGVSLNQKAFDNLFFGLNWEFARGGAIFLGRHYGKVNVFEKDQFTFQSTNITEAEFNVIKNTAWRTNWAFGAKLDIKIFRNLFGLGNESSSNN